MERRGEGWIMFAAIVLGVAGIMRIFDAIWAFRYHGALPENLEDAIFGHNPIWSLTYIAIGVLVIYALAAYGGKAEAP